MDFSHYVFDEVAQPSLGKTTKGWGGAFLLHMRWEAPSAAGEELVFVPGCFPGKQEWLGSCSCPRLRGVLPGDTVGISHPSGLSGI